MKKFSLRFKVIAIVLIILFAIIRIGKLNEHTYGPKSISLNETSTSSL